MVKPRLRKVADVDRVLVQGFDGVVAHISRSNKPIITDEFKEWMLNTQKRECGYCGETMHSPSLEHIQARSKKGGYLPPNIMLVCSICNSRKKNRHYSFMRISLQLKETGLSKIISAKQAIMLIEIGVDLQLKPEKFLHFETSNWPHVRPYLKETMEP